MNSLQLVPICKRLALLIRHEYKVFNLSDSYHNAQDYGEDRSLFIEALKDKGQHIDITLIANQLSASGFEEYVRQANYPVLSFYVSQGRITPVVFHQSDSRSLNAYVYQSDGQEVEVESASELLQKVMLEPDGAIFYAVPISMHPLVSNDDNLMTKVTTPVERLFKLLGADSKDIAYIYFYAIFTALITLALPVGIQAIVELISGGVVFNSIVLLIAFVILSVVISGALQVMQYTIVEILQRRVFVKAAFEFSYRLPRVKAEELFTSYAPELMNRFFDVLTIQKGMPKLLIDVTGSALQILFGLILLAFYHPFFVFFGLALIGTLALILYVTGPKGLKSNLIESKYKYKVVHWLEEIARTLYSFKLAGHTSLPLQKMDVLVNNYLHYRKKHFKILIVQFVNIIGFKTVVTGGLLIIGSWLVVDRQITLGQFVATEIVIILILNAVEKLILSMSTIYDMLTAVEKIANVTDLGLEKNGGIILPPTQFQGMHIGIQNLVYKYPGQTQAALNGLNLDIPASSRMCIAGYSGSGRHTFTRVISGMLSQYSGTITYNSLSLRDLNLSSLRDKVAKNVSEEDIFDGNVLENIGMGRPGISYDDVIWALKSLNLLDYVNALPEGLMTQLVAGGKSLPTSVAVRLILARCVAEKPQLLIISVSLHLLDKREKIQTMEFLTDPANPWTLLCLSNDPVVMSYCDQVAVMQSGKILCQGSYSDLLTDSRFVEILDFPYKKGVA